ncbi:MAG: hypothetical protein GEU99_11465, partial [Luteitalea sp.]|nr:hypothetical protein [Luteitalea sp.]
MFSFSRVAGMVAALLLLTVLAPASFIGVKCYSTSAPRTPPLQNVPAEVAGYARDEAATFLTLPKWYIIYSHDE